jgi:hypothetical protein
MRIRPEHDKREIRVRVWLKWVRVVNGSFTTRLVNVLCRVNPPGSQVNTFDRYVFFFLKKKKKKSFWYDYKKNEFSFMSSRVGL